MALKIKNMVLALVVPAIFLFLLNDAHSDSANQRKIVTFPATEKLIISFPSSSIDIVGKFIHENYLKNNDLGLERISIAPPKRIKGKKGKIKKIIFSIFDTSDNEKKLSYVLTIKPKKGIISFKLKMTANQVKAQREYDGNRDLNSIQFRRKINNLLKNILEDIEDYL